MRHQKLATLVAPLAVLALAASSASAAIVFDNFNTGEGNFASSPSTSNSTVVAASSSADRTTATGEVFEGAGSEKLVLTAPGSGTVRSRFLSNSGNPGTQPTFTVTSGGTDGFIGFAYKVIGSANGMQFGLNLDGPANNSAAMVGGVLKNAVADGQWHVVEWNLDNLSDWGQVAGIGGSQANLQNSATNPHTMDSIYFYNMAVNSTTTVLIDFVAKSDAGSIANLVAPAKVTNIAPADAATGLDSTAPVDLSWAAGANNALFDVYLGTAPDALALVSADQTAATYSAAALLPDTTYYWRVDGQNNLGAVAAGDVFSFRTAAVPEPSSALVLSGLLTLAATARRRNRPAR